MARIPNKELDRLKQVISLQCLAESSGIQLKKHGKDYLGLCPFHDDKEPSLVISPDKNLWHCLGACQTGGSVIDWVMKQEGLGFVQAVEKLQRQSPPLAASAAPVVPPSKPKPSPQKETQTLLNRVTDYYHAILKQHPQALAYLEKRGLNHPELIDTFKLGVANRTLTRKLADSQTDEGKAKREQLQQLGILRTSGHEHLNGCLVIPVLDEAGNATELYGRRLTQKIKADAPKHLYLPGPHRGVFNITAFHASDELILCESLIDALTFWSAGYRNVTASFGTAGFTDELLEAIKAHGIKTVMIAYDRDAAGDNAAIAVAERLSREGIGCYRVLFPKGMDANGYALKVQPAEKSLGLVLERAGWLGEGAAPVKPIVTVIQGEEEKAAKEGKGDDSVEPADTPPALAAESIPVETKPHEILLTLGNRHYRIRGLDKNLSYDRMKVNIRINRDEVIHVDTFDFYAAKPRALFTQQAARELGLEEAMIKRDLGKVLLQLEAIQEQQIQEALEPQKAVVELTEAERESALELLRSPDLLERILADFDRCGIVGEETNTLVGYLAAVSRKLDRLLALLIQSTSAAGKSALMDTMLALMPEEDRMQYSAMTGQSLYYMSGKDLKHKILAIAEEEGVSQASYALKLLQSEGELTIASTGKNSESGNLETQEYHVEGPVMLALTTTAINLDEELMNRCLVLTVNEEREQTRAIHHLQRERRTLEGLLAKQDKKAVLKKHQNAQRLLQPLAVVNPYARELTFLDDKTRTRRDHEKYLTLIESIALLHQHQRPIKSVANGSDIIEYIEVTLEDIETANRLAHEVLGRTLDELPPQTRRLLSLLDEWITAICDAQKVERQDHRFSRREIRKHTGWGDTQLRVHLQRLVDLEYLVVHRGQRGQSYVYELLYDGQGKDGKPFLNGLADMGNLRSSTTVPGSRGGNPNLAGSSRPQSGGKAGGKRTGRKEKNLNPASKNAITSIT